MHILIEAFLHLLLLSFNTLHSSATRLPLFRLDQNLSSSPDNYGRRFEARMKRDAMRVASLTRRLTTNEVGGLGAYLQHVGAAGEYFAEVDMGTPPQTQTLVIDTGSDILWVTCQCDSCSKQFDPKSSVSFADVGCDDLNCNKVDASDRGCDDSGRCTYEVNYADGTKTDGTMAMENITIGNTTVPNVPMGCSHETEGVFTEIGADGVLGLGGGSLWIVSQSGGLIGGVFSYCLGDSITAGWLGFGYENVPIKDTKWASLISNPKHPSFYYVDVVGISVGGEVLDIPTDTLQVNPDTGDGGVIIDTGTVVTRLANGAYEALRDKFKAKMGNFATVDGPDPLFDTCYNTQEVDPDSAQVPAVLFNISSRGMDPPIITLEAYNVLVELDSATCCLAFASVAQNMNILGNLQQEGTQITIDTTRSYVGFGPDGC